MAEHVENRGAFWLCMLVPLMVVGEAAGQPAVALPRAEVAVPAMPYDPLQPPAGLQAPVADLAGRQEVPLQLESVQTTGNRRVAVISGQRVLPGQTVRDYRLIGLDNRQAVLQGPQGRLVLWLAPALHDQAGDPAVETNVKKVNTAGVSVQVTPSIGERK